MAERTQENFSRETQPSNWFACWWALIRKLRNGKTNTCFCSSFLSSRSWDWESRESSWPWKVSTALHFCCRQPRKDWNLCPSEVRRSCLILDMASKSSCSIYETGPLESFYSYLSFIHSYILHYLQFPSLCHLQILSRNDSSVFFQTTNESTPNKQVIFMTPCLKCI